MSWIVLLMLCSFICLVGLVGSGLIYNFRTSMNRARRLELDSRQKVLAVIPAEYRSRANRDVIIFVCCILVMLASLAVVENLYRREFYSNGHTRGFEMDAVLTFAMASLVSVPFVWQWARCFHRSRQKVAELGENPFHLNHTQRWLFFGHLSCLWLLEEVSLIQFEHLVAAACGLPLLFAFLIFASATDSKMSWHENGIFLGTRFYTWDEITWSRWYENRCGIIFGHSRWQFPCPVHYLPAEEIGSDRLEALLEQYLPGKEREDVEDYLALQQNCETKTA